MKPSGKLSWGFKARDLAGALIDDNNGDIKDRGADYAAIQIDM